MTRHRHYGRYLLLRMYNWMGRVMVFNREGVWRIVMMRRQLRKFEGGSCRNCRKKNPEVSLDCQRLEKIEASTCLQQQ
jgi:hypothetical protein